MYTVSMERVKRIGRGLWGAGKSILIVILCMLLAQCNGLEWYIVAGIWMTNVIGDFIDGYSPVEF